MLSVLQFLPVQHHSLAVRLSPSSVHSVMLRETVLKLYYNVVYLHRELLFYLIVIFSLNEHVVHPAELDECLNTC